MPNIYNHDKKFTVYVSDKDVFGDIAVGSEIYYTFSNVSAENITRADDPKTGWVMLDAQNKSIEITSKTTVRLVTKRLDEFSEVSRYQLGIKPAAPTASERTGEYNKKIKAALDCTTENTEIYYTLDGSDPRVSNTRLQADDSLDSEKISIRKDTVVKAVVLKNGEKYSSVVTGTYEFVNKKPPKPIATLPQGRYTKKIGDDTRIETHFAEGSKVYYTISYEGKFEPDLIPNVVGIEYDGLAVEIKGHTIIKAVAVNNFGVKSDVAVFEYIAEPEAPRAAPSATIGKNRLPVVPVSAVVGSMVKYEVNGAENEIVCDSGKFYIDMQTGNAYADSECRQLLAEKGVATGYPDGEFKPQGNLSRAEFAALICRFAGLDEAEGENPFSDLESSHWAYRNILALAKAGLVNGYDDGTEREITRAEVMCVINKLLGRSVSDEYVKSSEFNPYTDLERDKWYYGNALEATVTHDYYLDDDGVEIKWEGCK